MSNDKPQINMRIQPDKSALFDASDGVTIRVAFDSPTQVKVEMWRERESTLESVAPDVGNIGSRSFRERLAKNAREVFNPPPGKNEEKPKDTVPNLAEDLGRIATAMGVPEIADLLKPETGTTIVDQLVDCVEKAGTLFVTPEGEPHAVLEIEGHRETHEVRGTRFRRWLRGHFYATETARLEKLAEESYERLLEQLGGMAADHAVPLKRPPVVRDQTLGDAIAQLEAKALYEKNIEEVFVRVGHRAGAIYVDLGSETWEAVEITAEGWSVITDPPVRFVRPKGMMPLPYPTEGGSLNELREVLTLGDEEEDKHAWALIAAFLASTLRPDAPEFPILVLLGGQGTAKSTTSRMLRGLVDPNVVEDTGEPRSKEELHIDADCSWLMAYDNLSNLSAWLSDAMCRIATGSAFTKRVLYSNRDREIFKAAQPQILNGISDVVTRGDIIDRGLLVNLPVIEEYREGDAVWAEFEAVRPGILGALYTAVSTGLRSVAEGEEITATLPRMASFAKWSIRVETALGLEPGIFLEAFSGSREEGAATVLESEPVSYRVYEYARYFTAADPWEGTSKTLLEILNDREDDPEVKRGPEWPKRPNKLSEKLRRIAPALMKHGVIWKRATSSHKQGRRYLLYYSPPDPGDDEGDDKPNGGDDTPQTIVPQDSLIDKPDSGGGTIGDDGDDGFSEPKLTPEERETVDFLTEQGMKPEIARSEVLRQRDTNQWFASKTHSALFTPLEEDGDEGDG